MEVQKPRREIKEGNPRTWSEGELEGQLDELARRVSERAEQASDAARERLSYETLSQSVKMALFSSELSRRESQRAADAADRLARSNRNLSILAVVISVVSMIFGGLSYCHPSSQPAVNDTRHEKAAP